MQFEISHYEFKDSASDDWQRVPEKIVLEKLVDLFDRLTPLLAEMIQGKEITTPEGIFRMKKSGNIKNEFLRS
jgi:hypothetical protein